MNVLIIEDLPSISTIIHKTLASYGYNARTITSKQRPRSIVKTSCNPIIIQNTVLEEIDSSQLCEYARRVSPKSFIIGIQSSGNWRSRISFLNSGADDCLPFPFPTQELLARIQALLRRPRRADRIVLRHGCIRMNPLNRKVSYDGHKLTLTKKEYQILEYMLRNPERAISRTELLDNIWDYKRVINSNTVDVHIQKLRQKFHECVLEEEVVPKKKQGHQLEDRGGERAPSKGSTKGNKSADNTRKSYLSDSNLHEYKRSSQNRRSSIYPETSTDKFTTGIRTVHGIGYKLEGNINRKPRLERRDGMPTPLEL